MDRHSSMFDHLNEERTVNFLAWADDTFEEARDMLEVRSTWHPIVRYRLAQLIQAQAIVELEDLGMPMEHRYG